jgi:hypothetical protein
MTVINSNAIERVLIQGDLSAIPEQERVIYYNRVCESLGLNPLTQPFAYIKLNGKLKLYALREATEQLRKIHNVSIRIVARELVGDVYVVTAQATLPNGRTDESIGAVCVAHLAGEALANSFMKAETKSKRRVTLSVCGLAMMDETEAESIPNVVVVDPPQKAISQVPNPQPQATNTQLPTNGQHPHNTRVREIRTLLELDNRFIQEYLKSTFVVATPAELALEQVDELIAWMAVQWAQKFGIRNEQEIFLSFKKNIPVLISQGNKEIEAIQMWMEYVKQQYSQRGVQQ